jgi:hypothetical protein
VSWARARATLAATVVAAFLTVAARPAGADLLCLDKAGNFVPCSQVTVPTVPPSSVNVPPATTVAPPATTPPPARASLEVGLPDLDRIAPHAGSSHGPGLARSIAVFDAALVALLAFATVERRRALH